MKPILPKGIGEMQPNQQQPRAAESKGSAASLRAYLAEIGSKGGKASSRKITPEQQSAMQEARKAAKAAKKQNDSTHNYERHPKT